MSLSRMLDRTRQGTHYADRLQRILSVCQDCGLLWHDERINFGNGVVQVKRVTDVEGTDQVVVTPQYEKYGLRVNPRVLKRVQGLGRQFAYALNVPEASVEVDGNVVWVRVPLAIDGSDDLVTFEQAWRIAPNLPPGCLLLGVDEEHNQLALELVAPTNVHAAVIGMTGSGKSTLIKTMILSAELVGGAQVALFDPSRGFYPLSGHPSVWRGGLFSTPDECEAGLGALARTLGRGMQELTYVFVDEVPELVTQRPRIREYLARLAQAGRHAGVHLVIGAQHLLASEMGPMMMRNVPVRLVGRVSDRSAAYQAAGRSDVAAENLRGRGDFLVANVSQVRHFQAAYVSDALLARWQERFPPRPPAVPVVGASAAMAARPEGLRNRSQGIAEARTESIPAEVIGLIANYMHVHGREPSSNWVYRQTRELLPAGGYSRAKARRAIDLALSMESSHAVIGGGQDANRR